MAPSRNTSTSTHANASGEVRRKSATPDLFEVVENVRAKAKSQVKTANMIGKFVTPILRRKVTAFVETQFATFTGASSAERPPKAAAPSEASPAARSAGKRSTAPSAAADVQSNGVGASGRARSTTPKKESATRTKAAPTNSKAAPTNSKAAPTKSSAVKAPAAKASPAGRSAPAQASRKTGAANRKASAAEPTVPSPNARVNSRPAPKPAGARKRSESAPASRRAVATGSTPENPLGIDGYDGLPSSSIVPLLDGLSQSQLRAVEAYESANRARRTVLHRSRQLQSF